MKFGWKKNSILFNKRKKHKTSQQAPGEVKLNHHEGRVGDFLRQLIPGKLFPRPLNHLLGFLHSACLGKDLRQDYMRFRVPGSVSHRLNKCARTRERRRRGGGSSYSHLSTSNCSFHPSCIYTNAFPPVTTATAQLQQTTHAYQSN